jgi:hypothetical protein
MDGICWPVAILCSACRQASGERSQGHFIFIVRVVFQDFPYFTFFRPRIHPRLQDHVAHEGRPAGLPGREEDQGGGEEAFAVHRLPHQVIVVRGCGCWSNLYSGWWLVVEVLLEVVAIDLPASVGFQI